MGSRTGIICTLLWAALTGLPIFAQEEEGSAAGADSGAPAVATDISRELLQRLPADEIRWLEADSGRFPVLLRKQMLPESRGGVILMHGYHRNLDWPAVISPLRTVLSEGGWWTVSVPLPPTPPAEELAPLATDRRQPPAPEADSPAGRPTGETEAPAESTPEESPVSPVKADYRDIVSQRVLAAVALLNGEGQFNIALVGHESGGNWATDFFAGQPRDVVAGLVLIETANRVTGLNNASWFMDKLATLKRRPILDLAGMEDVLQHDARQRLGVARRNDLSGYRHMERSAPPAGAPQADADLRRVRAWLEKNVRREMVKGRPGK